MYNPKKNVMWFPETIPTNMLGGKKHDYNSINGGIIKAEKLGLNPTKFWGGNVSLLGLIKEYGFYACPLAGDRNGKVLGFYVYDPEQLTKKGKALFEEWANTVHPDVKIEYVTSNPIVKVDNVDMKKALVKQLVDMGVADMKNLNTLQIDELRAMIEAKGSGEASESTRVKAEVSNGTKTSATTKGRRSKVIAGEPAQKSDVEISV